MSWLSEYFRGGKNPADSAMPYLNQISGVGEQYYNPFIEQGGRAGKALEGEYGKLLDPKTFLDELTKGYKPSEGYQYEQGMLNKEIGTTAAAGGVAGTPEHQRQVGQMTQGLLSKDMQQYLQNALGIYDRGIEGEKDFYNKGFQGSGALADLKGTTLGTQGGLAFQGTQQQNQNQQAIVNAIMKAIATALGGAGGFTTGMPAGVGEATSGAVSGVLSSL